MRVTTSFVVPDGTDYKSVLTGPAWPWTRANFIFGALDLAVDLRRGQVPLERMRRALEVARDRIEDPELLAQAHKMGVSRDDIQKALSSLASWCAAATLSGATEIAWREG